MPKRPVTPEIDDGAKYLTVVNPYPFRPNMYLDKPRELFAQWIAACIGPTYIRAFYYKPTSPGSIIVEVDESLSDFKVLLGLHKWSEFLKDAKGHDNTVSRVYYCTYSSDRIVQKNGWKRVDVQDTWLRKESKLFIVPYPNTYWCDVPKHSDVIQNDLCRPLPRQNFPPLPPPQPTPVVGTPEWQEWKKKQDSGKAVNAWTRNGPVPAMITPSSGSRPAWSTGTTTPLSPSLPPGLTRGGSSMSTSSGSSVGGSQPLSPAGDDDDGPQVGIVSEKIESALEALALGGQSNFDDDDEFHTIAESDSIVGPLQQLQYTILEPEEPVQSMWGDYVPSDDDDGDDDDDDDEGIKKAAAKDPELCKVHNKVCKKGICKTYAAQLREKLNRERQEQRRKEREDALAKREKKNAKRALSVTTSSAGTTSRAASPAVRAPPPHLRPGAARQLPAHLQRGAAPAITPKSPSPVSPITGDDGDGDGDGRVTPTPSRQPDDEVRSASSGGWGSISDSPWGPVHRPKGNDWGAPSSKPPTRNPAATSPANVNATPWLNAPKPTKAWGAWGAPSISASSMQRNHDNWSVGARTQDDDDWPSVAAGPTSAPASTSNSRSGPPASDSPHPAPTREWGVWGKAPSVSASSVGRNNAAWSNSGRSVSGGDARSVAASEAAGWGAEQPWGSTDAVKAARAAGGSAKAKAKAKTWADEVDEALEDEFDVRSAAASTESGRTWGNVSAGPW
ncbi:hypothetical protein LXA43DRAFT_1016888 [Ganoderma leucocontextum]|nr:hypothetical protein LXA43DRAFT_1016888 [Ganoderma leucocontextum]